jgi:hypothetical protein
MDDSVILESAIRQRAHENWLRRGCPSGSSERDWQEAERELAAERAAASTNPGQPTAAEAAGDGKSQRKSRRSRSIVTRSASAPAARLLVAIVTNARRAG